MKQLRNYITIRKKPSTIKATDETIKEIVKDELDKLGHDTGLNHIDVSIVTNMDSLFSCYGGDLGSKYGDLNPDISLWDVSNVKKMSFMFCGCIHFNQDISRWDVSNVKDMSNMFFGCNNFNQDLSQWDVRNVEYMYNMFWNCKNFDQDLSQWNVTKVIDMDAMFNGCPIKEEFKPKFKK